MVEMKASGNLLIFGHPEIEKLYVECFPERWTCRYEEGTWPVKCTYHGNPQLQEQINKLR